MLKKILLPLLMAAVVLPQSVSAAIVPNGTSQARGMVAAQNSLSASDQQAVKKSIKKMIEAANRGDSEGVLRQYSRRYAATMDGQAENYEALTESFRIGAAIMKAYGAKLIAKDIQFTSTDRSQPKIAVDYRFSVNAKTLAEMSEKERQRLKFMKGKVVYTLTSENGRWLIVAIEPSKEFVSSATGTPRPAKATAAPAQNQQQERKILQALFKKHIQALNKEDLQAYLATLDPKSAQYKEAQTQTQKLFKEYDLKYEVETIEVISIGQQNAVVKMIATVKKIKGGSFADSKIVAYNTLRKTSQGWRIADTQIESVNALASR
jgi:ketosteroid isomerase-like protein